MYESTILFTGASRCRWKCTTVVAAAASRSGMGHSHVPILVLPAQCPANPLFSFPSLSSTMLEWGRKLNRGHKKGVKWAETGIWNFTCESTVRSQTMSVRCWSPWLPVPFSAHFKVLLYFNTRKHLGPDYLRLSAPLACLRRAFFLHDPTPCGAMM